MKKIRKDTSLCPCPVAAWPYLRKKHHVVSLCAFFPPLFSNMLSLKHVGKSQIFWRMPQAFLRSARSITLYHQLSREITMTLWLLLTCAGRDLYLTENVFAPKNSGHSSMWLYLLIEEQRIGSLYSYDLLNTQYDKEVGRLARSNSIFYIIYKKIFRRSNSSFIPINSFMSLPKLNQPNHMCPSDSVLQKVVRTQYVTSHTPWSLVQIHHAVTSPRPWLSWSFRSIGSLHLADRLHSQKLNDWLPCWSHRSC
jgi:hypothetical protein